MSTVHYRLSYTPALDGIRGMAILGVVLHHSFLLSGGYLGVDIFFVLSGFLITSLLIQERETHNDVRLLEFYYRRGLRLLPALVTLVIAYSIYDVLLYPTCASTVSLPSTASYTLGYWSNWIWALGPHPAAPQLCSFYAMWSLAIEEQFYLIWPPLLVVLLRRRVSFRSVSTLLCTLLALMVAIRILLGTFGASYWRIFAGTDTHADPILIGCLLAIGIFSTPRVFWEKRMYLLRFCGPLALVALVILMVRTPFPSSHLFTVQFTVVGLPAALVILSVTVTNGAPITKVFAWAPLVWLGKLSYSIYL